MPLKLNSPGGGSVTLDTPSTASTYTLTVPAITGTAVVTGSSGTVSQGMLASGVAGNGPAFRARLNGNQNLSSGVVTKVQLTVEQFDTNNNFDTSTYRFTPTVAGYYQVATSVYFSAGSFTGNSYAILYKNTIVQSYSTLITVSGVATGSDLVYMNGSTDYLELYCQAFGSGLVITGDSTASYSFMSASLVRAA